jgi:DNA-binding NarL/FixJ family response regulator
MNAIEIEVLLIEDNKADAKFVERRLDASQRIKSKLSHAEWLLSALTLLKNRHFDVILLDLSLPDSHGIDTVVRVRREAPNTPIIVLSGQEDVTVAIRSMEAGADHFVVKKADMTSEELERELLYAIERSRRSLTSKALMQRSIERLTVDTRPGSSPPPPVSALATEHVNKIDDAILYLRAFLQRNSPAIAEQVEQLLHHRGYYISVQELRSLLCMDEGRSSKRTRKLSDTALAVVRETTAPVAPVTDPERELLEVLGSLGGDGE